MPCLTDIELQAIVDGEADERMRSHVTACDRCRRLAEARRADVDRLVAHVNDAAPSPGAEARLRTALAREVRGATALRSTLTAREQASWWPAAALSAFATAAGVALLIYVVLPRAGAPTTLSASEVLGRSLQTLSAAHGVELLEYELAIGSAGHGPHRIEQLVDHDHPAHFRFSNFGADGVLESAISQDPAAGQRSHLIRIDGRNYIFEFTSPDAPLLPLPQMAQAQVEAVIAMMQATSDQKLTVVDRAGGRDYLIQLPPVKPANAAGMLELYQARALVDGSDFRVREFEASGALLKQPYTVSFKLIRSTTRPPAEVSPDEFRLAPGPDDVVLKGKATADVLADVAGTALRELARSQARR